jgi:putative nucleotidyltransferase with HDIG domain
MMSSSLRHFSSHIHTIDQTNDRQVEQLLLQAAALVESCRSEMIGCSIYRAEGSHLFLHVKTGIIPFPEHIVCSSSDDVLTKLSSELPQLSYAFHTSAHPLMIQEELWGAILFVLRGEDHCKETGIALNMAVQAVERVILQQMLNDTNAIQNELLHPADPFTSIIQLLPILEGHLKKQLQFDRFIFTHPNPLQPSNMSVYFHENTDEGRLLRNVTMPYLNSITEALLIEGRTYIGNTEDQRFNTFADRHYYNPGDEYCSILRVPVVFQGIPLAVIHLYSKLPDHFDTREQHRLESIVRHISYAVYSADTRQRESIQERYRIASEKINQTVLAMDDLFTGTHQLTRSVKKWLKLSDLLIWFLDREQLILRSVNHEHLHITLTDSDVISSVFLNKKTIFFNDIPGLSWILPKLSSIPAMSVLITPIIDTREEQVIGIVMMVDRSVPYRFNATVAAICDEMISSKGGPVSSLIMQQSLERSNRRMIQALTIALDKKDAETKGHSERVVAYSMAIARQMKLKQSELENIRWGALLHDIGKIGIPDAILLKPAKLTDTEWEVMKTHPAIGFEMMKDIDFLEGAIDIVLYHHERVDGNGYPIGLKGEHIPLGARVFAIADAFDAITSDRPYRRALPIGRAREMILEASGSQFCSGCVEAFMKLPDKLLHDIRSSSQSALASIV